MDSKLKIRNSNSLFCYLHEALNTELQQGWAVPDDPTLLCTRNCSSSCECFLQASKTRQDPARLRDEPWHPSKTNFSYMKQLSHLGINQNRTLGSEGKIGQPCSSIVGTLWLFQKKKELQVLNMDLFAYSGKDQGAKKQVYISKHNLVQGSNYWGYSVHQLTRI